VGGGILADNALFCQGNFYASPRACPQSERKQINGLKTVKFCQATSNSWFISRYYLCYFPCLTAIYLILIIIFKMRTRPSRHDNG